ncbi:extracellular calcium-sensing receptor-like [Micropterus dolomieu]|uniref:extracellular calcium-sensing receptor-like n=1 Tax=Micropterus dolomieu TaxID=147949 RepID=UPI001E8ED6F9|nr:extracellular calcium-sensing receptor-like [Micropterus dolomieu]
MIGGIFPVFNKEISSTSLYKSKPPGAKCAGFDLRAFRWTQVMIFEIEEINKDSALLPNISLGYKILNSCTSPTNALRAALTLASRPEEIELTSPCPPAISALIAESGSSQSLAVAGTLGPFQVPVSYFSTCACLSDRTKYPTFFRTIPSDYFQAKALAALVKRFGWQWIGVIQSDNDYGRNGILAFTDEVKELGVCIAFVGTVLRTYTMDKILDVVEMIKQSTVKVIMAFAPEGDFYPLMKEVVKQNITGIQWIASEAWITATRPSTPEIYQAFGGALGFVVQKMAIPNLKAFLMGISPYTDPRAAFVRDFWEIMVSDYLQRVNFRNQFGDDVFFDVNGDPPASFDIINWQLIDGQVPTSVCSNICPVGTRKAQIKGKPTCCFDCIPCAEGTIANLTGATDCAPCPQEYWSNERKDECIPKTIEFLSYHEPMGIAITVVSLLGVSLSLATMMVFICYRETPVIKASNSELSCFLLISLVLCFLCPLTFIGRPTVWTCMLRHTAFGVTFALCISCVLGKTIVVVTAFKATFPGSKFAGKFGPSQQRIIVCSCTLIQIVICVLWLKLKPPFPDMVFKYSNKKIVLECNTGSEAAFYAVLGYIGFLAIICLVLAFQARKLPDNFNEAKFITFSMLIFCAVWITFIPAYVSSPGKFTVAVEIFAILSSVFGLFISIFAPKCYIILIKPEKNTKKHVMGKTVHRNTIINDKI